jgi:hypothetical protein
MKSKTNLPNALIIVPLALLMGGVGLAIAYFQFMVYDLSWDTYQLNNPPKETIGIIHIDYKSTLADPMGDTIYVITKDHFVYSNTLFEKEWGLAQADPSWEEDYASTCTPVWPGAQSDAQIWSAPPVEKKVVDSRGVRFEHAMAIAVRCYVLSEDGSLEVWTREDSAIAIIAFLQCGSVYALFGALLGIIIGVIIIRIRKQRAGNSA